MNHIAPLHEPLIREVPLSRLALAPENVRKTPADPIAEAEMKASIAAHACSKTWSSAWTARPMPEPGPWSPADAASRP